ncbi:hypothetical protein DXG01_004563 [Tephrocybe rancida]|nr:hypothetical protein DXG01_004563 [Tephrocybe rancida]
MLFSLSLSAYSICFLFSSVDPGPPPPTPLSSTVWSSSYNATNTQAYCLSYKNGGHAEAVKTQPAPAAVATASLILPINRSSGVNATVTVPSLVPAISSIPAQNKISFSTSLSALAPHNITVAPAILTAPAKLVDHTPSIPPSIYAADADALSPDILTTLPRQAPQVNQTAVARALANIQPTPLEWVSGPEWTWISAYLAIVFHFDSPHHLYTRRWPLPGRLIATATIGRMAGYTVWKMGEGYCSAVLYRHRRKFAARRRACLQQEMETGIVCSSTVPPSRIPATPTTLSAVQEASILPTNDTSPPEPAPAAFMYGTCPLDAMPSEWYAEHFKSKAWAVQTAFIGTCPLDAAPREIVDERISQLYGPVPFTCPADIAQVNIVEDFLVYKPAHNFAQIKIVEAFPGYASAPSEPQFAPFSVPLIAPVLIILALVELAQFYLLVAYRAVAVLARRLVAMFGMHVRANETVILYDTFITAHIFGTPEPLSLVNVDPTALNVFWGELTMDGMEVVVGPAEVFKVKETTVNAVEVPIPEVEGNAVPGDVTPAHSQDSTYEPNLLLCFACIVCVAYMAERLPRQNINRFSRRVKSAFHPVELVEAKPDQVASPQEMAISPEIGEVDAEVSAAAPVLVAVEPPIVEDPPANSEVIDTKVEDEVTGTERATSPVPIHAYGLPVPQVKGTVSKLLSSIVVEDAEPRKSIDIGPPVMAAFWGKMIIDGVNILVGSPDVFIELAAPANDEAKVEDEVPELAEQVTRTEFAVKPEEPIVSITTTWPSTTPIRSLGKPVAKIAGRRVVQRPKPKPTA